MSYTLLIDLKQETVRCILVETTDTHMLGEKSISVSTGAHLYSIAAISPPFLGLFL